MASLLKKPIELFVNGQSTSKAFAKKIIVNKNDPAPKIGTNETRLASKPERGVVPSQSTPGWPDSTCRKVFRMK
jgi:hypothetical protein